MRRKRIRFKRIVIREDFLRRSKLNFADCMLLLCKVRKLQNWQEHFKARKKIRQQTVDLIEKLRGLSLRLKYNEKKIKEALKR